MIAIAGRVPNGLGRVWWRGGRTAALVAVALAMWGCLSPTVTRSRLVPPTGHREVLKSPGENARDPCAVGLELPVRITAIGDSRAFGYEPELICTSFDIDGSIPEAHVARLSRHLNLDLALETRLRESGRVRVQYMRESLGGGLSCLRRASAVMTRLQMREFDRYFGRSYDPEVEVNLSLIDQRTGLASWTTTATGTLSQSELQGDYQVAGIVESRETETGRPSRRAGAAEDTVWESAAAACSHALDRAVHQIGAFFPIRSYVRDVDIEDEGVFALLKGGEAEGISPGQVYVLAVGSDRGADPRTGQPLGKRWSPVAVAQVKNLLPEGARAAVLRLRDQESPESLRDTDAFEVYGDFTISEGCRGD